MELGGRLPPELLEVATVGARDARGRGQQGVGPSVGVHVQPVRAVGDRGRDGLDGVASVARNELGGGRLERQRDIRQDVLEALQGFSG